MRSSDVEILFIQLLGTLVVLDVITLSTLDRIVYSVRLNNIIQRLKKR